jgi:HTH-type transcriptional regulator/antitoxin HigA
MKGLARALAECGIVLLIEPCLKGSKIDGAACFTSNGTAVSGLTARYDRFDILLFTLLHELAHLTHQHVTVDTAPLVDDDVTDTDAAPPLVEQEANDQAAAWLFPRGFEAPTPPVSVATIGQIAAHHSVHPSVVIGRLQRDRVLDWSQLRTHIPKVRPYLPWIDL